MARKRRELRQLNFDGTFEVVASRDLQEGWGGARKGAGRPKTSLSCHSVTVRLTEFYYKQLQDIALIRSETVTASALHAVKLYLEMMIDPPETPEEDPIM